MELLFCISHLLTISQHTVFQRLSANLAPYGITPGQCVVLNCLWQKGPCTPKEIARELHLENSTISGALDRMQKRGVIAREVDSSDRRSVRVVATQKGLSIQEGVLRAVEEINAQVLGSFTRQEQIVLLSCLQKISYGEVRNSYPVR